MILLDDEWIVVDRLLSGGHYLIILLVTTMI